MAFNFAHGLQGFGDKEKDAVRSSSMSNGEFSEEERTSN